MIVLHDPTQDKFQLSSTNVISNECFSGYASVQKGQVKALKAGKYLVVYNSYLWDMTNYSCRIIDAQVNDVLISWTTGSGMNGGFVIALS